MKLRHTLAAVAALVALLAVSVTGAGAQDTYYVAKKKPKLTLKVKPKRDRSAPFKFKASGKLKKPASVSKAKACKGTVKITIKKGSKTVGHGKAKVKSNCKYSKTVKAKKAGKLKVHAKFGGNSRLKTATAKVVKVRAG